MKNWLKHILMFSLPVGLLIGGTLTACDDLIYDDRDGCDRGVYVHFKYDYNLQRADMFADHVGEVTLYVFDEQGKLVQSVSEGNDAAHAPLKESGYALFLDLPVGKYQLIALAQQRKYADLLKEPGAKFVRTATADIRQMDDLTVTLDHRLDAGRQTVIAHDNHPLDTLWHARSQTPLEVVQGEYVHHTLSLVRDTKYLSVTLRHVDAAEAMDINDYELYITDTTLKLDADNEAVPYTKALCTPYVTWNTQDPAVDRRATDATMGHADFMTSRLFAPTPGTSCETLVVKHKATGKKVIEVNLPDFLCQLRNYDELHRYSPQEFLDRGYDFDLTFFLSEGNWKYAQVAIGVLGWSKRIQRVDL